MINRDLKYDVKKKLTKSKIFINVIVMAINFFFRYLIFNIKYI